MSDLFRPIDVKQLAAWLFRELDGHDSAFGIPRQLFYVPDPAAPYRTQAFGQTLETPFGPAAGPHSQMAQNIVAAWLCGARYIELKTVQTLDELDVSKPCIDMEDEGYNVEWSQELKVHQSFEEYLRAWVLIHALHHKLEFPGNAPALFNLSVGYDLAGIRQPNMQWFLDQVADCSGRKQEIIEAVARHYPAVRDIDIPDRISDSVTLSTMHGCPPGEIEGICEYLLRDRHLHTLVKCNPTLLGPERVRTLINKNLGFSDVVIPDIAFEHDLKYDDAVPMLRRLQSLAADSGLEFGVKLSNTLEVENRRDVFSPDEKMMYLSGRPLHAVTVNLAATLADEFNGELPMSFSAGASCYNAANLLQAGMQTITVCSDLLKTGGYLRLLDYIKAVESVSLNPADAPANLRRYAEEVSRDPDNMKSEFVTSGSKTDRELGAFDCIEAPCIDACPLGQRVPEYMGEVCRDDIAAAQRVVHADNPLPCTLGRICDHLCEQACVRTHLDEPVAIRDIKRFIVDRDRSAEQAPAEKSAGKKVAIIGAGPGGMSAALELARGGLHVEIFEAQAYAGGMVGGVVPEYRLPRAVFAKDYAALEELGVKVHYNVRVGRDLSLVQLRDNGFHDIVITVGAQLGKTLSLAGADCNGVVDALQFLRQSKENRTLDIGKRVGIIGAGDTAMDCARVAWRLGDRQVTLIYRRTIEQMPADREEITQLLEEGIEVLELASPISLLVEGGNLRGLQCRRMQLTDDRDGSGRRTSVEVADSDFDISVDTLILAISQHAILDFLEGESIAINDRGYIDVDPETFATSVPGVYAGGDVANDGPATIVKAAAAGKAIANAILGAELGTFPIEAEMTEEIGNVPNMTEMLRKKSQRRRRIKAPERPLDDRQNFKEVMLTYSPAQARIEASRCLDCHTFCSICVGVCPNLALFTYETDQRDQHYQVAVLADLCNECGNCTTFCPTSGAPYRDKPRLYINRDDLEAQQDNAFMIFNDADNWAIDARYNGSTRHLELSDPKDIADAQHAAMHTLLKGVQQSMPFLPTCEA
ncbi:MAG: putative selenate reductase subunit YgfK [Woeseiaceae bacterium]